MPNLVKTLSNQKGITHIYIAIAVVLIGFSIIAVYRWQTVGGDTESSQESTSVISEESATPSASLSTNLTGGSANPVTKTSTPTSKPTSTAKPSSTTTNQPTATSAPNPTNRGSSYKCDFSVVNGKLDGSKGTDPLFVTLVASFSGEGSAYIKEAQWDFNGDDQWDTDSKQSNQNMEHTFTRGGDHNVRLKVVSSEGSSVSCSKTITLKPAVTITMHGEVFQDLNCNNVREDGEGPIEGMIIDIADTSGLVHATVTTNSSGFFSYNENIEEDKSLSLIPNTRSRGRAASPPTITFNKDNKNAVVSLSSCI